MRRVLLSFVLLVIAAPFVSASAVAGPTRFMIDLEAEDCLELMPAEVGVAGVTDPGQEISLDVLVYLDFAEGSGVALKRREADAAEAAGDTARAGSLRAQADADMAELVDKANLLLGKAKTSYAPLKITLRFTDLRLLKPLDDAGKARVRTTDAQSIINLTKAELNGVRPAGTDLVYTLTDLDMTAPSLGSGVAGLADCIGGVRYPNRAFAVGEIFPEIPIGPVTFYWEATAKIAAHELGHLMGAHHHYQDCAEGIPSEVVEAGEPSPCTLMTNFVDFQSLNFSVLEGAAVRGHAVRFASP